MYAVTSIPLVSRTRATLRSAEFGFFGVTVYTRVHTPRRWGAATRCLRPFPDFRPGVVTFLEGALRPLRTSWLVVGMRREMLAQGLTRHPAGARVSRPERPPARRRPAGMAVLPPRRRGHTSLGRPPR